MADDRIALDRRFQFDGQSVAWTRMGNGPPLVLVHGTPFSSQVWRHIAPHLARGWSVHLFDLLGYGASEMRDGQDVSLGVQNRLLAALFAEWEIERPDVLAHDFGGATALRAYNLDGLRYRSLTLFDVVALQPWGSPFVTHVRRYEDAFRGLPDDIHEAPLRTYIQGAAYRTLAEEALEAYVSPWRGAVGKAGFYRQIAQMDRRYTNEIEPLYGPMDCPVQILQGEKGEWVPIEQGERLAAMISEEPLIRVPNAGHLVQDDAPEAIVAAMFGGL